MECRDYKIVEEEVKFYRDLLIDHLKERNILIRELIRNNYWKENYKGKNIALEKDIENLNNEISNLKNNIIKCGEYIHYEMVKEEVEFFKHLIINGSKERNILIRELIQNNYWKENYKGKNIALEKEIEILNNEIGRLKTTLASMNAY